MKKFTEEHIRNIKIAARKRTGKNAKGKNHWRFKDETGNSYGMLTVVEYAGSDKGRGSLWKCKCSCGGEGVFDGGHLRNGHTISCGCLLKRKGKESPVWKGGIMRSGGYRYIYKPEHPNVSHSGVYVAEHVLVMSESLGRALYKGEVVHHINGVKNDNRIENLELCVRKNHKPGQAVSDIIEYAINMLRIYKPDALCKECHKKESEK
jgi:hypothetical protein